MFKREISACLLVLAVSTPLPAAPLPDEPASPLELRIRFDRAAYLVNEPVFVEWTLTNVSRAPVFLPRVWDVYYKCSTGQGKPFPLEDGANRCRSGGVDLVELRPGQSIKGYDELWLEIYTPAREEYQVFSHSGQFTFWASYGSCYSTQESYDEEDYQSFQLRSNHVTIGIEAPTGADAAASKHFPRPGYLAEYSRQLRLGGAYEPVLQTKSERFNASMAYYYGWQGNGQRSIDLLTKCIDAKASSRYLKGLASYRLLQQLVDKKEDWVAGQHALALARWIVAEFPDTYMAQETRAILEHLEAQR